MKNLALQEDAVGNRQDKGFHGVIMPISNLNVRIYPEKRKLIARQWVWGCELKLHAIISIHSFIIFIFDYR